MSDTETNQHLLTVLWFSSYSLDGLQTLWKLEYLNLSGNKVLTIDNLRPLCKLPLIELKLRANPICLSIAYPYEIFLAIPTLQHLDEWLVD